MDDYEKSREIKKETKREIAKKMLEEGMDEIKVNLLTGINFKDIKLIKSEGLTEEEKSIMIYDLKNENKKIKENIQGLESKIQKIEERISKIELREIENLNKKLEEV